MKRKLTLILVLITTMLFVPATASAQEPLQYDQFNTLFKLNLVNPKSLFTFEQPKPKIEPVVVKPVEPPKPVPVVYTVVEGDNLTKIGTAYNVEWQRLWAKNTQLNHPDRIDIGDKITIPEPSEQLTREIPVSVALPTTTPGVAPRMSFDGSNTYDYGYCTWYVKNRRGASLANGLGNANTWYARAAANGMAVGSVPRPGAVGTTTRGSLGHVVYVESVNADGSITISEMNAAAGWGNVNTRTASASEFVYIY